MPIAEIKRQSQARRKGRIRKRSVKIAKARHVFSLQEKHNTARYSDELILRVIKAAGYEAAQRGMESMGFIVAAENDYIVKQFPDGRTEKISSITKVPLPEKLILD